MMCLFNDPGDAEIYADGNTLSLHDALPICRAESGDRPHGGEECGRNHSVNGAPWGPETRTADVGRGYAPDARAIWHARPPTPAASGYRATGASPRPTALRVSGCSTIAAVHS